MPPHRGRGVGVGGWALAIPRGMPRWGGVPAEAGLGLWGMGNSAAAAPTRRCDDLQAHPGEDRGARLGGWSLWRSWGG